jgi:hypothetical protein
MLAYQLPPPPPPPPPPENPDAENPDEPEADGGVAVIAPAAAPVNPPIDLSKSPRLHAPTPVYQYRPLVPSGRAPPRSPKMWA